ncbi:MAG: ABC transporter permease, partial [Anaerolineae bacterium]|nr:ABC transporter permease [Anaerolineae bacterium]
MTTAKAKRGSFVPNLTSRLTPPLIALILAIVLFLLGGVISPGFVNANQAINIVRLAAFLGIIAAGQTLVIISGGEGIDLSVASVVTLGAILTFRLTDGQDALILPVLGLVMLVGAGIGLVNGLGIVFLRIPPLVMTLAMAGVVQGVILQVTRGELEG